MEWLQWLVQDDSESQTDLPKKNADILFKSLKQTKKILLVYRSMTVASTEDENCGRRTINFHNSITIIERNLIYYADVEFKFWAFSQWDLHPLWVPFSKSSLK